VGRSREETARLKEELDASKRALAEIEGDRNRRLLEAQGKLTELGYKYTDAHPMVLAARQAVERSPANPPAPSP